ncbi:MAG: acyl-CoA dehydrogenase family protein [Deltaproteobacteria bacterium]|nr:acyl-CoA dehydrogenase family protein [Deltaproteobacteria bacterium]
MDFKFTEKELAWRDEVEEFVKRELPPDWTENSLSWPGGYGIISIFEEHLKEACRELWRKLGEKGWLSMGWPGWPGEKYTHVERAIYGDIISYYGAPAGNIATGIGAGTIIMFGSDEMKKEWLPRIAAGEVSFWLAYSEPNAGSDLASLQTSAVEDGDDLVINGSKIWSSGAHVSDCAWMVVRTDTSVAKKYQGITLLIVPNDTPGIEIRPLINICGIHSFNEVFFDNVRVSKKNIVGDMHQGWYYLMVALGFERLAVPLGGFRRTLEQLVDYTKETLRNGEPLSKDPLVRNRLADIATKIEIVSNLYWQIAWKGDRGLDSETDASIAKLVSTEISRDLAFTAMDIMSPYGQLGPGSKWAPLMGRIQLGYLDCISALVGAGTNEIQRNIIALRGLGLPRGK